MASGKIAGAVLTEARRTEARSLQQLIVQMRPQIEKALPSAMTGERFARMVMTAMSTTPELAQCTPKSFLGAMMQAAQLGMEPNSPLGQAYLIPYRNHGQMECQFQLGYKGLIELAYRSGQIVSISAHAVHEGDVFEYELGVDEKLVHKPAMRGRGAVVAYYAVFRTRDGHGFAVMSKEDVQEHMKRYSKAASSFSPWNTNFDAMAKKTVIKKALKYAPIRAEFARAMAADGSVKSAMSSDMLDEPNEMVYTVDAEAVESEVDSHGEGTA